MNPFNYVRRPLSVVHIGDTPLGSGYPVRVQSMANVPTMDTDACVQQAVRMIRAGAEYVRFTAQGEREANNLREIRRRLDEKGYHMPLVADIHFNPKAAAVAAQWVEKVRINPGNYSSDPTRLKERFTGLLRICKEHHTAIRIGVNHGSLSERIMNRYGDTPEGMVASCMEFLKICREERFDDVVISMKASNTVVMVQAVRLLVQTMDREDMHYPLHLGVTEAGDGEDGRIKSAVGIGTLLADGIGDTIRVSLSEEPECEIPVARKLIDYIGKRDGHAPIPGTVAPGYDPIFHERRLSRQAGPIGGGMPPAVITEGDLHAPGIRFIPLTYPELDDQTIRRLDEDPEAVLLLRSFHVNRVGEMRAAMHKLLAAGCDVPVVFALDYDEPDVEALQVQSAADFGTLLLDGFCDGIMLSDPQVSPSVCEQIMFGILQATRTRISKTEFISCPGCGRTLYDLQSTVARVKQATSHLKGLKIGIMGCIVNGPGEMADADYGYVGSGRGKIDLYKGKQCVRKNIPEAEAVEQLIGLIQENGDWTDR